MWKTPLCKLCLKNPASYIKSHIYPSGVTKFLKGLDKQGKVFTLNTSSLENRPGFHQDSLKIPYLLCKECENNRLNSVEAPFLRRVYNGIRKPGKRQTFPEFFFPDGTPFRLIPVNKQDPAITYLIVYSIVWRVSIAPQGVEGAEISYDTSNFLRKILDKYLGSKPKETQELIDSDRDNFPFLPFGIFYEERPNDLTDNFLASITKDDLIIIFMNDLIILFSLDFSSDTIKNEGLEKCINDRDHSIKLIQMLPQPWQRMKSALLESFNYVGLKQTFAKGEIPYPLQDYIRS